MSKPVVLRVPEQLDADWHVIQVTEDGPVVTIIPTMTGARRELMAQLLANPNSHFDLCVGKMIDGEPDPENWTFMGSYIFTPEEDGATFGQLTHMTHVLLDLAEVVEEAL